MLGLLVCVKDETAVGYDVGDSLMQVLVTVLKAQPTFLLQGPFLNESVEQSNSTGMKVGAEVEGDVTGADVGVFVGFYDNDKKDKILDNL